MACSLEPVASPVLLAFLGWSAVDYAFLAVLAALLGVSAFFSGSETALFGMTAAQRAHIRRLDTIPSRAVESLLSDPRRLLITVLMANMTVNVLFFVISSVLMMRASGGAATKAGLALVFLLSVVLFGEVLPKITANAQRTNFARLVGPLLLTVHHVTTPLRTLLDLLVVTPLSRLTAPGSPPPELHAEEIKDLIELSGHEGIIDPDEQRTLQDVLELGGIKVRQVMTPRVRMHAVALTDTRDTVVEMVRTTRLKRLPVYGEDLDDIVGRLPVKRYLLGDGDLSIADTMVPAQFVPQIATLEQLLERFRRTHTAWSVVVDEFGGTAGVVSLEDVVDEIVGHLGTDARVAAGGRRIGKARWRVAGDTDLRDWCDAFAVTETMPRVSTVGGLVTERLGKAARSGDVVRVGRLTLRVAALDGNRVADVIVTAHDDPAGPDAAEDDDREGELPA